MKRFSIVLTLFLAMLSSQSIAQKIGHVNLEAVVTAMPQYKLAMDSLQTEQKKITSKLQKMEAEYNRQKGIYTDSFKIWSMGERTIRQNKLAEMEASYQQFYEIEARRLDTVQQVVLARLIKKVQKATKAVAAEKGITYVLNYSEQIVLYYEESHDLTAAVRKKLGLL